MKYLIFFSFTLLSLVACKRKDDIQTTVFNKYLYDNYGLTIGKSATNYVILPKSVGCIGCKLYTLNYLSQKKTTNTILICSSEIASSIPSNFPNKILIDTFGNIDKLNLKTQNVAIIFTKDNKVDTIISTESDNIKSILEYHFRSFK